MANRPPRELTGMTAVVTGSSSGIGRTVAGEFAAAGAAVVIHARRSQQAAEEAAQEVRDQGGDALVLMADLADSAVHEKLVEQAWAWRGKVDLWMNNAGADVLTGEAARWPFERKLQELWQVDVAGTMRLARLAGARMRNQGGGTIINVGWDQAEFGMAGDSGELFAAVKGAVMAFTRSLARSLAPQVRVNCLAPGWIKTSWGAQASEEWQRRAMDESLLGRWGTPQDIAGAARFLASPASSFVTGQILNVNGGFVGGSKED